MIARDLGYLNELVASDLLDSIDHVRRMLSKLRLRVTRVT
jgi:hypothetical protein